MPEQPTDRDRSRATPQQSPSPLRPSPLVWAVFAMLAVTAWRLLPGGGRRVHLTYSVFREQVEAGNIKEATFDGSRIEGTFVSAYRPDKKQGGSFQRFRTVVPPVEDHSLIEMLRRNGVRVDAVADSTGFADFLFLLLPWLVFAGILFYTSRRAQRQLQSMMGSRGGLFGIGRSRARRYRPSTSRVTFGDVAGLESAKADLREIVAYLSHPNRFARLGARVPRGLLLVGPPGTGKTLLARATAGEAGVAFFSMSGSEFIEMFVGVGASRVRDLFQQAKEKAPTIVFIDEIDSIGRARGTGLGGGHDEREQTLNQILSEMDGFEPNQSVVVVAATNRPDVLDSALTRPGRFDRQITLDLPQRQARAQILRIHSRDIPLQDSVDLDALAARTVGFSGADLGNLINEAALLAGRREHTRVGPDDIDEAVDKIMLGAERDEIMDAQERRGVAVHESGHAIVASELPNADPLRKVTIIARGRALGATHSVPGIERHNLPRSYLLDRIAVMTAGRAAEELALGDITSGAGQDLEEATRLARMMVCRWGMSERVGPVTFRQGREHPFLERELAEPRDSSEHMSRLIDTEVRRIVHGERERAQDILMRNRAALDRMVKELLRRETISGSDVRRIIDGTDGRADTKEAPSGAAVPAHHT